VKAASFVSTIARRERAGQCLVIHTAYNRSLQALAALMYYL
jgi:hypothetical protein